MRLPGFVGPTYRLQSPVIGAERAVNLYVQRDEVRNGRPVLLLAPGVSAFATGLKSPNRGCFAQDGRAFAINDDTLYEIGSGGVATVRASGLLVDGNPAQLASNGGGGNQLAVCSGGRVGILNLTTNAFTANVLTGATHLGFIDGYFSALDGLTGTLKLSALNNGLAWTGGSATRSAASDKWIAMGVTHREIWLMGSQTSEPWINLGGTFPFAPREGAFLAQGIASPYALTRFDNSLMWLGQGEEGAGMLWRAEGYSPARISTHAIEIALQAANLEDAVAWSYQQQGHWFSVLTLPQARQTYVYDASTGLFHERGLWVAADMDYQAWRPQFHMYAFNKHLVGDRSSGTIYELTPDVFVDADGAGIRWLRRAPVLSDENVRLFAPRLELEVDPGVGLTSGQGSNPEVMYRGSWDGGKTFGTERKVKVGKIGEYTNRAVFTRCGSGRRFVPEFSGSDPVPWRILDLFGQIEKGNH